MSSPLLSIRAAVSSGSDVLAVGGVGLELVVVSIGLVAIVFVVVGGGVALVLVVNAIDSVFKIVDDESTAVLHGSC